MKRRIAVVLASVALCWATAGGASEPSQPTDNSATEIATYDAISAQIAAALAIKPVALDGCQGEAPDCDGHGAVCCGDEWQCCGSACPGC